MHQISPGGFAIAIGILAVVWIFLPYNSRVPFAFIMIAGALAATQAPAHYVQQLFSYVK